MKAIFKRLAFCFLLTVVMQTVTAMSAEARYAAPADSSHVEIRVPPAAAFDKFRNDSDFNYTRDIKHGKTFRDMIQYYIAKFFRSLYGIQGSDKWLRWLWIALLAVVTVFGLIKMLGVKVSGIFFSKPLPAVDLSDTVIDENVDRDQLAAMLEKALGEKQYRLAVRLAYIITLKRMAEAGQIRWQADKTNRSYLNEIADQSLRQPFAGITRLYEYVWYGDFDINAEHYRDIKAGFDELNRRLR